MPKEFTMDELLDIIREEFDDRATVIQQMSGWLERGDGVAVYRNEAFDHSQFGHRQFTSYGSPAAQIETAEAPVRMPDIGGAINWPYQLEGTYRGALLVWRVPA